MSGIKYSFYNYNLFSGSSDRLRTAIGGYWEVETVSDSDSVEAVFTSAEDNSTTEGEITTLGGPIIDAIKSGYVLATTSSADIVVPSFKMPIRLVGNGDTIEDDLDWKNKVGDVFSAGTKRDTNFEIEALYQPLYIKEQDYDNLSSYKLGKINYNYNYYLPIYQNSIKDLLEVSIPNCYFYISKYLELEEHEAVDNYVSVEGSVEAQGILNTIETTYPPTYDVTSADIKLTNDTFLDKLYKVKKYLSSSLFADDIYGTLSASTITQVSTLAQNLYFNQQSQDTLFATALQMKDRFPFMVTLAFPVAAAAGPFGTMIAAAGYENLMLNYIKNRFVENAIAVPTSMYSFLSNAVSSSLGETSTVTSFSPTINVSEVDFYTMALDTLMESSVTNNNNFYIVGGQNDDREKIINTGGTSCYAHSIPSLKLLESVQNHLNDNFYFSTMGEIDLKDILDRASLPRTSETIAYRIQKSTGIKNIATARETMIQNFIISNSNPQSMLASAENRDGAIIYDSQVKYGETYTYVIYAYVVVSGYDYSYDNLVVSREIANVEDATGNTVHCLEFFSPGSGEASPALYSEDVASEETENSLFTDAQISTYDKYLADFNVTVEPSIKILEIPIFTKIVSILDHPLQSLNVYKFQRMNNSRVIGFFNNIEPFVPKKFPYALTQNDEQYKASYLGSNDLLASEKISTPPRAPATQIQIFKKNEKPTAIDDFSTVDIVVGKSLAIKNSSFALSSCLYEEKVNVNTKYYYVFRARSENETIGHITNVIEAELIDDGGYLYSIFEEYDENDFHTAVEVQISEQFKKLIRLVPNINQVKFDDANVDYANTAYSEMDNLRVGTREDSIFGKTFKIRLTSKKTGKKIDLNVMYKLI